MIDWGFSEEWKAQLARVVEAVAKNNIERIRELDCEDKKLRFEVRAETGPIRMTFYYQDGPVRTDSGFINMKRVDVVCRDQYGLWDGMLNTDGLLMNGIHFMGMVPDAARKFGEHEVILPETLSEWLGE